MNCLKKNKNKKRLEKSFKLFKNIIKTFFNFNVNNISDLTPSFYTDTDVCYSIENITSKLRSNSSLQFLEFFEKNKARLNNHGISLIELPGPIITETMDNIGETDNVLLKITTKLYNPERQVVNNNDNQQNIENKIDSKIIEKKNSFILRDGVRMDLTNVKHLDANENTLRFYQLRFTVPKTNLTKKIFDN